MTRHRFIRIQNHVEDESPKVQTKKSAYAASSDPCKIVQKSIILGCKRFTFIKYKIYIYFMFVDHSFPSRIKFEDEYKYLLK